ADIYDEWFRDEFVPWLEGQITIRKGAWALEEDSPGAVVAAGKRIQRVATQTLVGLVNEWSAQHFPEFYRVGLYLWEINQQIVGIDPDPVEADEDDANVVGATISSEVAAWQQHVAKHVRHVERLVDNGLKRGWTTEQFLDRMTAPDGHIVGFMYGNARLSWQEHLRRYAVGRPKVLAQTALERRAAEGL
ncbi:MAG: hypothetical protein R6X33_11110, partial [Candidatus Brocadiia bacterium]